MKSLVGYTGLVGSNILATETFEGLYNSKNVTEAYGTCPDLLVYSGMTGTKYLANHFPSRDYEIMLNAIKNISEIRPKKLVLISTVDVYDSLDSSNEDLEIDKFNLHHYGKNRLLLEQWVKSNINDYHIIRIGALYGCNLKKNFVYDMIHRTPSRIPYNLFSRIILSNKELAQYYEQEEGYFVLKPLTSDEGIFVERVFEKSPINALSFTDSRAQFQFYNLKNLWQDIKKIISENIQIINLVTEPLKAQEVYQYIYNQCFQNITNNSYPVYNIKTKYDYLFHQDNGYIEDSVCVLDDLKSFVLAESKWKEVR